MSEKTEKKNEGGRKKLAAQIIAIVIFIAVSVAACVYIYKLYKNNEFSNFEELVSSLGAWGVLFMLFIQTMQVVFAVIPGEPIELAMGALYGTWWGCVLCLAGCVAGTLIIFMLVKWLGKGFIDKFADSEKFKKLKFLQKPTNRDIFVFLLMFIPGTPKDLLTYFSPFTGINMWRFLIISTAARIPSVVSSTYVGKSFANGDYVKSIIVFAVVGVISLAGIVVYNRIIDRKNRVSTEEESKSDDSK